jgi:hypothetical protein
MNSYRLSDHNLETGRHRKTWLPREHRLCGHCQAEKVETEEHFLYIVKDIGILRQIYCTKLQIYIPDFADMEHKDKIAVLLGEGPSAALAAQYVLKCHNLKY